MSTNYGEMHWNGYLGGDDEETGGGSGGSGKGSGGSGGSGGHGGSGVDDDYDVD